ncbi:DUF4097 family beta strand repeat-containing protein [Bariatricus sp. SGI.161]|uniref:DUF4097 family beta strand repeat-containing protein n=1 Tax=Lachnospiraceae TaxID=186803 RepID=UPI002A781792|nr:DUF4097 domain-containing protein [Lachnospiraceae bacterium]MCI6534438.1 DUF4097 domain-containing protein [Lachnospiraceae bacterium]MDY2613405.1 DUF4097 family beta strand repeat-containing protein [Lachnospiraceae bacterium]MDY4207092.1 DUF4097 family beta strand repeat-containing protein [Lachnospiraceae bacterium]
MRRGWKIFWIVCGVTAGIGLACCVAAWGLGVTTEALHSRFPNGIGFGVIHWDDESEDAGEYIAEDIHQSFHEVRKINAEIFAGEVEVLTSDSEDIIVETDGISEKLGFRCYMENNELKLSTKKNLTHINHIGIGTIRIYLPKEAKLGEVSLDIGAGTLYVEDVCTESFSVDVGAGEAEIDHFSAAKVDLNCDTGSLTARGSADLDMEIECGVGEIQYTAEGEEHEFNYDIECGIGEIICGENSYSGLSVEKRIDNGANKEMQIECGVGNVTVEFEEMHHEE